MGSMRDELTRRQFLKVAGLGAGVVLAGFPRRARGGQVWHINPGMMGDDGDPRQINYVINTLASPGDTILFEPGIYESAIGKTPFNVYTPGVTIKGSGSEGANATIFRREDPNNLLWRIFTDNVEMSDFRTESALCGILIRNEVDFTNIRLKRLNTFGHLFHVSFPRKLAPEPTVEPNIIIENCLFDGSRGKDLRSTGKDLGSTSRDLMETGVHFSGVPPNNGTPNTKYVALRNNTFRYMGIGHDAPYYSGDDGVVVKAELDSNVMIGGGSLIEPELYPALVGGGKGRNVTVNNFRGIVESQNVQASLASWGIQPGQGYMENREYPFISDLLLDADARPAWQSPLRHPGYRLGYCGAKPPIPPGRRSVEHHSQPQEM